MVKITEVTQEYKERTQSADGRIIFEKGYNAVIHKDEIAVAQWLGATFGGDVTLQTENAQYYGMKTPDFLWDGAPWELKRLSTENPNTVNSRIRKAFAQLGNIRGGIIVDITASKLVMDQAVHTIMKSVSRRSRGKTDVIIKKGSAYRVFRTQKE